MNPSFSLQRVLELKERREQVLAARLAEARTAADAARKAEEEIDALRRQGETERAGTAGTRTKVGQLQNASYVLERLEARLSEARTAVRQAEAKVNECMADFTVASRDRQVLDRLKERKLEAALIEAAEADQKTMDAVALSRFVRGEKPSGGSKT